jgi:CubicO group peptidase (beta-lactamase class C family)
MARTFLFCITKDCFMSLESRLNRVIDTAISGETIVGAVVLVHQNGSPVYERTAGYADRESGKATTTDTIFRMASVTKPLVAATALALVEKGKLALDARVSAYLPWFHPKLTDGTEPEITIHHLLTHTSGLAYDSSLEELPLDDRINQGLLDTDLDFETNFSRVNRRPLGFAPGTGWMYSYATDILGAAIATVSGSTLEEAVVEHVCGPLGMPDTRFRVVDMRRLATAYADQRPRPMPMTDPQWLSNAEGASFNFSPSRIFNPTAFQSGGAGMAGTARDFMRFLDALQKGGDPILSSEMTAKGLSNQTGKHLHSPGVKFGYFGSVTVNPEAAESCVPAGTVKWGGVYGNSWLLDPSNGISLVAYTNTALEGCTGAFPNDLVKALYAA